MRRAFALGLVTGVVYFTGTLYWITRVMAVYGGLPMVVAVLVNAALVAYLALFPAIFAMVMRRIVVRFGPPALLAAPCVWVTTELGRTHLLTGFPWVLLGYSQATVLPIAQWASVCGVYGVSGLVASVSAAAAFAAVQGSAGQGPAGQGPATCPELRGEAGHYGYLPVAITVALVIGVALWGSLRVGRGELTRTGEAVRVGLVQGNVDQAMKWNPDRASTIFQDYLRLTRQAIREGAQFVIWPESSTPFYFDEDRAGAEAVRTIARQAKVPILVGSDQIEHAVPRKYYNAAILVGEDGSSQGAYRKMHLVPFGEYVPLQRLLFFAAPLVEAVSDFSPGTSAVLLPVRGHLVSTSICYEVVYPDLVRTFVRGGSELLTTITNDAWFGATSAPYQHFAQASMRAIEDGRYLVRAANTGISGIVDPYGRVLARTDLYTPAVVVGEARFLTSLTLYARMGDVFAYGSAALTLALLLLTRRRVQYGHGYR